MKEPLWIDIRVVVALNDELIAEYGGRSGVRDEALLGSALIRPQQILSYGDPDLFGLAAAYVTGIVRNHPFIDGNKRTGFVAGALFLERNGAVLDAPEAEAAQSVWDLADKTIAEEQFAAWLKQNCGS